LSRQELIELRAGRSKPHPLDSKFHIPLHESLPSNRFVFNTFVFNTRTATFGPYRVKLMTVLQVHCTKIVQTGQRPSLNLPGRLLG
jgi:hypothetical protein